MTILTLYGVIMTKQTINSIEVNIIVLKILTLFVYFIFSHIISEGGGAVLIVQFYN